MISSCVLICNMNSFFCFFDFSVTEFIVTVSALPRGPLHSNTVAIFDVIILMITYQLTALFNSRSDKKQTKYSSTFVITS